MISRVSDLTIPALVHRITPSIALYKTYFAITTYLASSFQFLLLFGLNSGCLIQHWLSSWPTLFVQPAIIDVAPSRAETHFFERCRRLSSKVETVFSREEVHNLCIHIIFSMERNADCFTTLLDIMASAEKLLPINPANSSRSEIPAYDQRRILVTNTEKAFTWHYNGEHARTAFLEYLDIQWLKMLEEWHPLQGTLQSRCGTIIQSSCAGKSRLVDRYSSEVFRS